MKKLPVPNYKQQRKKSCGPCALAMVFSYHGSSLPERQIQKALGGLKSFGVRTVSLAKLARQLGHSVTCLTWNPEKSHKQGRFAYPRKKLIIQELQKGNPVILTVRAPVLYGKKTPTKGHFLVVTGYGKGRFNYNDPRDGREHTIAEDELMFSWLSNVLESSAYLVAIGRKVNRRENNWSERRKGRERN